MAAVNPRKYDASRRRRQAQQTKSAILAAARKQFLQAGYGATTVSGIAKAAGVSVETIYKSIGPKPAMVRALWEEGLAGRGPMPAEQRSDDLGAHSDDAATLITGWAALMAEVAPRVTPILLLIRAAAAVDPDMAELHTATERQRRERMRHNAVRLLHIGGIRRGLDRDTITDILWIYSSPELYELLVLKSGWSADRYSTFAAESMLAALVDRS